MDPEYVWMAIRNCQYWQFLDAMLTLEAGGGGCGGEPTVPKESSNETDDDGEATEVEAEAGSCHNGEWHVEGGTGSSVETQRDRDCQRA